MWGKNIFAAARNSTNSAFINAIKKKLFFATYLREHVKKLAFLAGHSAKGVGSDQRQLRNASFFKRCFPKEAGRFEMKNCIKMFL